MQQPTQPVVSPIEDNLAEIAKLRAEMQNLKDQNCSLVAYKQNHEAAEMQKIQKMVPSVQSFVNNMLQDEHTAPYAEELRPCVEWIERCGKDTSASTNVANDVAVCRLITCASAKLSSLEDKAGVASEKAEAMAQVHKKLDCAQDENASLQKKVAQLTELLQQRDEACEKLLTAAERAKLKSDSQMFSSRAARENVSTSEAKAGVGEVSAVDKNVAAKRQAPADSLLGYVNSFQETQLSKRGRVGSVETTHSLLGSL